MILSFHSTLGIRLLFNVNHLPLWLSFCIRVALGLLGFSYMDDMCMSDVLKKKKTGLGLSVQCVPDL